MNIALNLFSVVIALTWFAPLGASQVTMNARDTFPGQTQTALAEAVAKNDCAQIAKILATGANVNLQGKEGMSLLIWAIGKGSRDAYKCLLDSGADANLETEDGESAISVAALADDSSYLKLALDHGGDANRRNSKNGQTPIYAAIGNFRTMNVDLLMAAGAKLNVQDNMGTTPMLYAAGINRYDFVLKLLGKDADPSIPNKWNKTVIDRILRSRPGPNQMLNECREKVIALLKQKGFNVP
jgi:uncharacterized protein